MSTPSTTQASKTITEDEFFATYKPVKNHFEEDAAWNGCMFETYGQDLAHVQAIYKENPNRVWTVLDVDGVLMLDSGMSYVNRFGFILTDVPAPDNTFISVQDEDDALDSCDSDSDEG